MSKKAVMELLAGLTVFAFVTWLIVYFFRKED